MEELLVPTATYLSPPRGHFAVDSRCGVVPTAPDDACSPRRFDRIAVEQE